MRVIGVGVKAGSSIASVVVAVLAIRDEQDLVSDVVLCGSTRTPCICSLLTMLKSLRLVLG